MLNPDRLFPLDNKARSLARELYATVRDYPIISPHGHTDPKWFAENESFGNPSELLIKPDHYVFRMLYSQGVSLETLGINPIDGSEVESDPRKIWQCFAEHYHLFRGTPSRMWLDHVFSDVFNIEEPLSKSTAEAYYENIDSQLQRPEFRPRELFDRFNIELLATTESPLDSLEHHRKIIDSDWGGRVITSFRPDNVVDPEFEGFTRNVEQLGALTGEDVSSYSGYLKALRERRIFFKNHGATATDHGHPSAATLALSVPECEKLYAKALSGSCSLEEAEQFRAQMLTEMAVMSLDDGLVMQIHPGSYRNHNTKVFQQFGRDKGCDIPLQTEYVRALHPLLSRYGSEPDLTIVLFTLDESTYSREIAPLVGHYPCLKAGPAWWFHDSPEGMRRFRQQITETAGLYNTAGFNDDTRAFLSIPARHDVARRIDCGFLAEMVGDHRIREDEAFELIVDLTYNLAKSTYKL